MKTLRHAMVRRALALSLVASLFVGCYGSFNLVKKVHHFNGDVGNEWVNELVFLGFVILPIYSFATLGDAIIFNTIEFWGGTNPISPPDDMAANADEGDATETIRPTPATAQLPGVKTVLSAYEGEAVVDQLVLEAGEGRSVVLKDSSGAIVASACSLEDGSVAVFDRNGIETRRVGVEELERARQRLLARQ